MMEYIYFLLLLFNSLARNLTVFFLSYTYSIMIKLFIRIKTDIVATSTRDMACLFAGLFIVYSFLLISKLFR